MKKRIKLFCSILLFFSVTIFSIIPQESQENKDVILLIDVSNSMKTVFNDVKNYLTNDLIKEINVGDNVFIIKFYGQSEVAYNKKIESDDDIDSVKNAIRQLSATGPFTDIGNALDALTGELTKRSYLNNKKYVLLLSDGRQEAPQGSKYFTEDYSISHELLKNAKEINREGWKIEILSIGDQEGMKEIAKEMGATYKETSEAPTSEEIKEKTEDFFKELNLIINKDLGKLYKNKGIIKGTIKSTYNKKVLIDISKITINDLNNTSNRESRIDNNELVIRNDSFSFVVNENEEKEIEIPTNLLQTIKPGNYTGELEFTLNSDAVFSPTSFLVTFDYPCLFAINLIPLLIIAALLIALIVFLIIKFGYDIKDKVTSVFSSSPKKLTYLTYEFRDGTYKTANKIFFKKNEIKSVGNGSAVNIPRIGLENNIAEILFDNKGFHLITKKPNFFKNKTDKDDFLNKDIEVKSNNNKIYIIKFTTS